MLVFSSSRKSPAHLNTNNNSSERSVMESSSSESQDIPAENEENKNNNAQSGGEDDIHRLQFQNQQRQQQQRDFMEAFNDAILAKEAAKNQALERLETIHSLEIRIRKLTTDYERIIQHKVRQFLQ